MNVYQIKTTLDSYPYQTLTLLSHYYDISSYPFEDQKWLISLYIYHIKATMPPAKAWTIFRDKLLDRFKNDPTAPKNPTELPNAFIDADPSTLNLEWLINSYLQGGIKLYEDLSRAKIALQKYKYLQGKGIKLTSLSQFCGIAGCIRIRNKQETKRQGLEDYLDIFKTELQLFDVKIIESAESESERLVDNNKVLIISPKTAAAACKYGQSTRWCTAATEQNQFESYNQEGPLYILIPKKPYHNNEKYQIHIESNSAMNEKDNEINWNDLLIRFPSLKNTNPDTDENKFMTRLLYEAINAMYIHIVAAFISTQADPDKIIIENISRMGLLLKFASDKLKKNRDVVKLAVTQNKMAFNFASEGLKNDEEIVKIAVQQHGLLLKLASKELKEIKEVVKLAVEENGYALEYASDTLKNNVEVVTAAVKQNGYALKFASKKLMGNKEVVTAAVKQNGYALEYASKELTKTKEIVKLAVKQDGLALKFASKKLRNNKEVVIAAVKQNEMALQYASNRLKNNKGIVAAAVTTAANRKEIIELEELNL